MASATDETRERLIDDLRPRLREHMKVEQVLDHLHHLEPDQRERIRLAARTRGNAAAADALLDALVRRPHGVGWFGAFLDALVNGGCGYAADCVRDARTDAAEEAENDQCVRLIQILSPSLVEMNTAEVRLHCVSDGLISQEDSDVIEAETTNRGSRSGARELMRSIVRGRPGWFSQFLQILRVTEHQSLYELTGGGSPEPGEPDLYTGENAQSEPLPNVPETSEPDAAGPAAPPEPAEILLRDYQADVAGPALEGKNIIVCLPTGRGKTRVAVYITQKHLERRRAEGQPGKVVVLVNKIPLVEQHYSKEFLPFLKHSYRVGRVSGDCQLKITFPGIVKANDVIVCTAQILENYLERSNVGEDEGVNLSDLSLVIIDECHHTQKGGVYNHIMLRYLKQKHKNRRLRKELKEPAPLPQILGLTATPGVGGATKMDKAVEHILRICANLDASRIMTGNLGDYKKEPSKSTLTIEDRKEDPFGDVIKKIMTAIHTHAGLSPNCDLGSQSYQQWIVEKERKAAMDEDHRVRVCAEHLRQYGEGLNLSSTIRMRDAFLWLKEYHEKELKRKSTPDEEHVIRITDTERFLFNLFIDNKEELERLSENSQHENNSLSELRRQILKEFSSRAEARGIVFTKTRRSAIALSQWIQENAKFADIGVKAAYVLGGGDQSVVKPMTAAEQRDVLKKFHSGEVNLLIATDVVQEGVDVPACNFVISYGHVTNEIAMIQTEGRGRAEDSSYTLVEVGDTGVVEKECVNEYRKSMMGKAMAKISAMSQEQYEQRILEFQIQAINEERVRKTKKKQKSLRSASPSEVKLSCRGCSRHVCTGDDVRVIESMHVVDTPQFRELFIQRENTTRQERHLDHEANGYIACKDCAQTWGVMIVYRSIDCPCLNVKNFVVTLGDKKIVKCTKWMELPVQFAAFDYVEHAQRVAESSDDDD